MRKRQPILRATLGVLGLFAATLIGCASDGNGPGNVEGGTRPAMTQATEGVVKGQIMLREGGLPDGSTIQVELLQQRGAYGGGMPLASTTIQNPGDGPIGFELSYDPAEIETDARYVIEARAVRGDQLVAGSSRQAVLSQGYDPVAVLSLSSTASATQQRMNDAVQNGSSTAQKTQGGDAKNEKRQDGKVTGEVTWGNNEPMPESAVVVVNLLERNAGDGEAKPVASTKITGGGRKPLAFTVPYEAQMIDPGNAYRVEVRVMSGGVLRMLNSEEQAVITQGNPDNVTVRLEPVEENN